MDWFKPKEKYVLGVIDGNFGYGKTVFLTMIAVLTHTEYNKVYANFQLKNIPNFEYIPKISRSVLLNLEPNSLLLVMEAYHWLDKRYCMKKENIKTSQAIFQIRKTKVHQFYDVPKANYLDFRAIDFGNFFIRAKGEFSEGYFIYSPLKFNQNLDEFIEYGNYSLVCMSDYFNYYDTDEIVDKQNLLSTYLK